MQRTQSKVLRLGERAVHCASKVKDETSGAMFPLAQQFWEGENMRCLGAVTRIKKILIVNVQASLEGMPLEFVPMYRYLRTFSI